MPVKRNLFRLCVPVLMLGLLASCRTVPAESLPPRIDCAAYDAPRVKAPVEPSLAEKALPIWQLYAWAWQAYAEDVLNQRLETAVCLETMKRAKVIR